MARTWPPPVQVSSIYFSSTPPNSVSLGQDFLRHARLQVLTSTNYPVDSVPVTASVTSISLAANPQIAALDCSTLSLAKLAGTLEAARLADVCTPVLTQTTVTSSDIGLVEFMALHFARGPPGFYTLTFTAGAQATSTTISVGTTVYDTYVVSSGFPTSFTPGQPLSAQPSLFIVDQYAKPVAGKTVIAFVLPTPFDNDVLTDVEGHDIQGQRYGVLGGQFSAPSDANGIAVFDALAILGASSPVVYIGFYVDGTVVPLCVRESGGRGRIRECVFGCLCHRWCVCVCVCVYVVVCVSGVITSWSTSLGSTSSQKFGAILPSLPTYIGGSRVFTSVCGVSVVTPPSPTVTEGAPFPVQPTVRVADSNGVGLAGKVTRAVCAFVCVCVCLCVCRSPG